MYKLKQQRFNFPESIYTKFKLLSKFSLGKQILVNLLSARYFYYNRSSQTLIYFLDDRQDFIIKVLMLFVENNNLIV